MVDRQTDQQMDRQTNWQTHRWVDWQGAWLDDFQAGRTVRQKDRQADGLTQWLSGGRQTGGQTDWLTDRQMGKLTGCLTGWLEWWSSWKNEKHSNYIVNNLLPLNSEIFRLNITHLTPVTNECKKTVLCVKIPKLYKTIFGTNKSKTRESIYL